MIRRTFLGLLAAIGLGGAAHAAVVPSITDSAAIVLYDPGASIIVTAGNPVATPGIDPAADFVLLINTLGNEVDLTVEDADSNTIVSASGFGFTAGAGGITVLLNTFLDTTGLFGSRLLVSVNIADFDPSQIYSGLGELVIENAPVATAAVPLPATAPLLAGGLVLIWATRRRRKAA